jgi:hypothetical protein
MNSEKTLTITPELLEAAINGYSLAVFPRDGGSIKTITVSIADSTGNRFFMDRKQNQEGKWVWKIGKKMESRKAATQIQVAAIAV